MKIKLLNNAKAPKKQRPGDCGWDLYLNEDVTMPPHETTVVDTNICLEIPKGYVGQLAIRSSIAMQGLILQNPLIDSNYRGQFRCIFYNATDQTMHFKKDERICSLYCFPYLQEELVITDALSATERGDSWNGSSGK